MRLRLCSVVGLIVLPRLACEALVFSADLAFISITNPKQKPAVLPQQNPVLRLRFHDINALLPGYTAMSLADGIAIFDYIDTLPSTVKKLVIHCEHVASRSSAVGLFLSEWLSCPVDWDGNGAPNSLVLRRLYFAAMRRYWYSLSNLKKLSRIKKRLLTTYSARRK